MRDAFAPPSERAVALCWVFHLAGDIQQPLHAGHLVSRRFPLSDRAGTAAYVRPAPGAPAESLHQFWDDAAGGDADDPAAVEAARIRLEAALPRSAYKELDGRADEPAFRAWADESLSLARTVAYAGGTFQGAAQAKDAEPVSANYLAARTRLGERRVALGGYRIADALRSALAP